MNLDYMRSNRPGRPELRTEEVRLPDPGYQDPIPDGGGSLDPYYGEQVQPENSTGVAGTAPGEEPDPTNPGQGVGGQSVNLGSQNINFRAPVLSLAGRAGSRIDLALSYNSKVWNLDSERGRIFFNADKGSPAPGWRIGLGVIQGVNIDGTIGPYFNAATGANSYIYIQPDGTRRDLRYNNLSGFYESYDSSWMEFNDFTKVVRLMDGTQISFATTFDFQYLATEIKDRNGNRITIINSPITNGDAAPTNGNVEIEYIIDTFGRRIDFYYESNRLRKVRQDRGGGAWFDYVTIGYTELTVALNFGGLIVDPAGMDKVWVPSRVDYPTGSNYRFYYTSYAQMWMIEKWVPTVSGQGDERSVAYTRYDLPTANGNSYPAHLLVTSDPTVQGDCPRFANRYEYGEWWNAGGEVPYAYSFDALVRSSKITDPLGRIYETAISTDGLTHTQKIFKDEAAFTASQASKTVTIVFEQDSGLAYQSNLRVAEVSTEDADNVRKTTYGYPASGVKLPIDVTDYYEDETNIYRHTRTDYEQGVEYTNRHIFGLPAEVRIYDGEGTATIVARTVFSYDEPTYFDATPYEVTGHDSAGYGPGLITGRGNLTTITQYDVKGSGSRALRHTKYDITGVVSAAYDGAGHTTEFYYEDNFTYKPIAEKTHSPVTRVRDGDGYWSGAMYDWYTGNTRETYHLAGTGGDGAHENVTTYVYTGDDRLKEVLQPTGGFYERVTGITGWRWRSTPGLIQARRDTTFLPGKELGN